MKRRSFFKNLAGVIAGFAIAPIVIKEIKETPPDFNEWAEGIPDGWGEGIEGLPVSNSNYGFINRGGWNCHNEPVLTFQAVPIDYKIGDKITSIDNPKVIGTCTGFMHDNTCVVINGNCWGGKYYFRKHLQS